MHNRPRKRLSLPLHTLFVICQYMGAAAVCLGWAGATPEAALWPGGPVVPRRALLLWPLALLAIDLWLDDAWMRALKADLSEGGGLHCRTLEALAAPVLFVADVIALLTILACQRPGAAGDFPVRLHTAAMAAGITLWIYGRLMPRIPYRSVWGIRSAAAMKDAEAWGAVHLKAMPWVCAFGVATLCAAAFLPPVPAAATAAACLIAAFAVMFSRK